MPKLTVERQKQLEQELQALQQATDPAKAGASITDVAGKISTLARILAELLAAWGASDHAKAMDAEIKRPTPKS
jgi:hypothetical protein